MIKSKMQQAVNDQITAELWSSNLYLQMSFYLKHQGWDGFAHWMRVHSDEERKHAKQNAGVKILYSCVLLFLIILFFC